MVMQYIEGLTDRQAADAVRRCMDWKYALQTTSRHCLHQCGFKPIVSHRLSASISTLGLYASETSFCRCVAWLLIETTQSGTIDFIPHQRKGFFGEVCLEAYL